MLLNIFVGTDFFFFWADEWEVQKKINIFVTLYMSLLSLLDQSDAAWLV